MLPQEKLKRIVYEVRKAAASQSDAAALSFPSGERRGRSFEDPRPQRKGKSLPKHFRNIPCQ